MPADHNGEMLRACEADGIVAYVPEAEKNNRLVEARSLHPERLRLRGGAGRSPLPGGKPNCGRSKGYKQDAGGKLHVRYDDPPFGLQKYTVRWRLALSDRQGAGGATIYRWEHQDVIDRHRARMAQAEASTMMRRRASSCRASFRHPQMSRWIAAFSAAGALTRYAVNGA